MTGNARRCPDPEVHAAFVAGTLSGAELTTMIEHLRECDDCRQVVAAAALIDRQFPSNVEVLMPRRKQPWWLVAAAAALAGLVFLTLWWMRRDDDLFAELVAAAPRDARYLEPRVSGDFPWAPLRAMRGTPSTDPAQMRLTGAAGEVLQKTANDTSIEGRHAAAVAHLVTGHTREAESILTQLAPEARNARIWSDLAAARYALALAMDDPSQFAGALAAADAALRIDSRVPEARFNRALAVDALGLREQARAAWEQYLEVDPGSEWANEARRRLAKLAASTDFRGELTRSYERLTRDPAAARALAARFPQDARVWGETEILGRWAEAVQAGDEAAAEGHVRVARAFADELARSSGDGMLRAAVAAVRNARGAQRDTLAAAHLAFRKAQKTYQQQRFADAEQLFAAAAEGFDSGGSPVALLARYFVANTAYDQGRIDEARARLESLIAEAPAEFPAHRAQLQWQLGLAQASAGRWGDSIRTLSESVALFERLGEKKYATSVRTILAEVYERIGDPHTAWQQRLIALQVLGQTASGRLQVTIDAIARAAAAERDWLTCISFLGLQLEMARRGDDDLVLFETLLLRARIESRNADKRSALADLAEATRMIKDLRDPALRERAEADRLAVAALLATEPRESVTMLARAIEYHRTKGRRMFLPELLLHRGRALAAGNDTAAAAADFEEGIRELEHQRTSLDTGDARWGVFSTADELFDEAMLLALGRRDVAAAFAYSERARARELLESIESRSPALAAAARENVVLLEYASLPARLIIFVVEGGRVRAVQQAVSRSVLDDLVHRLGRSIETRDDAQFRAVAALLYERLLAPVTEATGSARTLIIVPDATLSGVPFAALIDQKGRHLIERHAVIVAPSAAVFARLAARDAASRKDVRLLVISGPPAGAGDLDPLSAAWRETKEVAAAYGRSAEIAPKDADQDTLEARAASSEIIHFAGHVVTSGGRPDAALMTSAAGGLRVRDIASMALRQTRVVVLAACSSARGQELAGEGSISVARAFLAAGVPSVVATLWPIDDEAAADFFPRLHRHLASGSAPAEALRAAQIECIRRGDTPLSMWAAVQVLGS